MIWGSWGEEVVLAPSERDGRPGSPKVCLPLLSLAGFLTWLPRAVVSACLCNEE